MRSLPNKDLGEPRCSICWRGLHDDVFRYRYDQGELDPSGRSICSGCLLQHTNSGAYGDARIVADNIHRPRTTGDADKLFAELFRAARVLLHRDSWWAEERGEEDQIIPTLMLAHKAAWQMWALWYDDVKVVDVVDGVPILEQIRFAVRGYKNRGAKKTSSVPRYIAIHLLPHWRALKAAEVSAAYEQHIERGGGSWCKRSSRVTWTVDDEVQRISVLIERFNPDGYASVHRGAYWPAPSIVGAVAEAALTEYGDELGMLFRKRGGHMSRATLVPAVVALLLSYTVRTANGKINRTEIHRLLNEYVLPDIGFRLGSNGTSEVVQLWNTVSRIREVLYGARSERDLLEPPAAGPLLVWRDGPATFAGPFPRDVASDKGMFASKLLSMA